MPVSAVFQFAVPSPHASSFVDGETALAVASPIGNAAGNTTYFLSRWFDFEGGVYTIKCVADDSATWIAAVQQASGRILFSNTIADGVAEYTVYIPRGRQRLDIILVNTSSGASNCWVAFSLRLAGKLVYASTGTGWVFDTSVIADADVPSTTDRRLTFPLFSVLPNWKDGITERLSYNTEVFSSEQDEEQRRGIRRNARRSIEADFLRRGLNRARLDFFFTGVGKKEVLVPLWHEQYVLTGTLGSTLAFPAETLALREFLPGTLAAVIADPDTYEILTIQSAAGDTITFSAAPSGSWPAGSRIYPLRVGRMIDSVQFSNFTDSVAVAAVRFNLEEPQTWPDASWGYCAPLFRFPVDRAQPIDFEFDRSVFMLDNETGVVDVFDPGERTRVTMKCGVTLRGRSSAIAFRQFLQKARGRAVRFWMPDLMSDVFPAGASIGGTYFDAADTQFSDRMVVPQDARRMLGFYFIDGRPAIYRSVTSVDRVGQYERYTLDRVLPPITVAELSRVGFVMPVRFDQDSFELQHLVDDSAAVRTSLVMRSSERDDLPEIECFTTSRPYPVDHVDSLDLTAAFTGGDLRDFSYPAEGIDVDADFSFGQLRNPIVEYDLVAEGVDVSAAFTAGSLRLAIVTYDEYPPEAIDVTAVFAVGSLREGLIQYEEYPAEALDVSAAFTAGSLT